VWKEGVSANGPPSWMSIQGGLAGWALTACMRGFPEVLFAPLDEVRVVSRLLRAGTIVPAYNRPKKGGVWISILIIIIIHSHDD
jgi:hypothetical protein